jgi:uncharacterized protein YcbK (DUF882 family)
MMIEQLTPNFHIKEWRCHDGTDVPYSLVENVKECAYNLQILRDKIGKPVHIISGYRNPTYNKRIGGASRSYHMKAMAADIKVKGMTPRQVKAIIEDLIVDGLMKPGGVGIYRTFIHYDCRGKNARWVG